MSVKKIFFWGAIIGVLLFLGDEAVSTIYRDTHNQAKASTTSLVGQVVYNQTNVKALISGPRQTVVVTKGNGTVWDYFVRSRAVSLHYSWNDYNQAWTLENGTYLMVLGSKKIMPVPTTEAPVPNP
jgi:hypothetical protein